MRRLVSIAVFLSIFAFVPLAAQDESPHVYRVDYIEVLDAKYITYVQEVLIPVWDEFVRRGLVISYDIIARWTGTEDFTHMVVSEYASWDDADALTNAAYADASQAVHGTTYAEASAEYTPLSEIRTIRSDVYVSVRP